MRGCQVRVCEWAEEVHLPKMWKRYTMNKYPASYKSDSAKPRAKQRVGKELGKEAAEKSKGLFSAEDWMCSKFAHFQLHKGHNAVISFFRCGNVNWARRHMCNVCNAPKTADLEVRTGPFPVVVYASIHFLVISCRLWWRLHGSSGSKNWGALLNFIKHFNSKRWNTFKGMMTMRNLTNLVERRSEEKTTRQRQANKA
jgi:hypothetical protein